MLRNIILIRTRTIQTLPRSFKRFVCFNWDASHGRSSLGVRSIWDSWRWGKTTTVWHLWVCRRYLGTFGIPIPQKMLKSGRFPGDSMGGMGGQGGFHGNIDPEELFRFPPCSWICLTVSFFVRTIFGDRSGGNPFAGGINFGHQVKRNSLGQTQIFTFQGGGAEQFDFGPKEYHVTLSFQQAAMGVWTVWFTPHTSVYFCSRWQKTCMWALWTRVAAARAAGVRRDQNQRGGNFDQDYWISLSCPVNQSGQWWWYGFPLLGVPVAMAQGWKQCLLGLSWWEVLAGEEACLGDGDGSMCLFNFFIRRCQGKGTWNKNPCSDCRGHGQANHRKKVLVCFNSGTISRWRVISGVGTSSCRDWRWSDSEDACW